MAKTEKAAERFCSSEYQNLESDLNLALSLLAEVGSVSAAGLILVNSDNAVIWSNETAAALLKYSCIELVNKNIETIIPRDFRKYIDPFSNMNENSPLWFYAQDGSNQDDVQSGLERSTLCFAKISSGQRIPIELTIKKFTQNQIDYRLFILSDQRQKDRRKRSSDVEHQRFKLVSDAAPIGILQANRNWEATYVNDYWCQICGLSSDEVLHLGWINSFLVPDIARLLTELERQLRIGKSLFHETKLRTPLGEIVWVELRISPLILANGVMYGFVALLSDVSSRNLVEQRLRRLAERDGLTGLYNRNIFHQRLIQLMEVCDPSGQPKFSVALINMDLDGFKNVNDTLGHSAGDYILSEVAQRVREISQEVNLVTRYGGDEFFIVVSVDFNKYQRLFDMTKELADKILKQMAKPFVYNEQEITIGASMGIAFWHDDLSIGSETLMMHADTALYHAKSLGRNNYQIFDSQMSKKLEQRQYLLCEIKSAAKLQQFKAFYQVQSNVMNGQSIGVEALIRWQHPKLGLLTPEKFIPILESSGYINEVSLHLWRQIFEDFMRWKMYGVIGEDSRVSINVSPIELIHPSFWQNIMTLLEEYPQCAELITLEITESILLNNGQSIQTSLRKLRNHGFQIALDDFGTGYSSLTYLRHFPINYLKIDQSFIKGINTVVEDAIITETIIRLAKFLNLKVVAEGVEQSEQLIKLHHWGCDFYQGYLLNQPCNAIEVEAYFK